MFDNKRIIYGLLTSQLTMQPSEIRQSLTTALTQACREIVPADTDIRNLVSIETPQNSEHGDYASPVAMSLAKVLRKRPLDIANDIVGHLVNPEGVDSVNVIAPGFINFSLKNSFKIGVVAEILQQPDTFAKSNHGKNKTILLEFISANPNNSRSNHFTNHQERNDYIRQFVYHYNHIRLNCLKYKSPIEMLTNQKKLYTRGWN